MKPGQRKAHQCVGDEIERTVCSTVAALRPLYDENGSDTPESLLRDYPDATRVIEGLAMLIDAMFPGRMANAEVHTDELGVFLMRRLSMAWRLLRPEIERSLPFRWRGAAARAEGAHPESDPHGESIRVLRVLFERMPAVRSLLIHDVRAAYEGDPAALSYAEVQLAYPGVLAIASHRLAHELYRLNVPVVPRIMSEWTHSKTGVDIHPGACIGKGFFIDHATGVVIGETCEIGEHVKIYQGVTLGAQSFSLDAQGRPIKHVKRHPKVGDRVIIYANATLLGGETVIGEGSTIGGNVFLMESVPPNSYVTGGQREVRIRPADASAPHPPSKRAVAKTGGVGKRRRV